MTDHGKPLPKHKGTAKEHLAGIRAAQDWIQDLSALHLLDTQQPIKDLPLPSLDGTQSPPPTTS